MGKHSHPIHPLRDVVPEILMSNLYGHSHRQSNTYRDPSPAPPPIYGSGPPAGGRHHSNSSYGGHSHHHQQGPPPGADPQLWQWFSAVDLDRSGALSANELQRALVNGERDSRRLSER
jgi:hypothetical protein